MIFPVGLLAIAEDIVRRIPTDPACEGERNTSWLAIGKAYLQIDLLPDTVSRIEDWEDRLSRKEVTDLVKPIARVLGSDLVQMMHWRLRDPFTASNVLVALSGHLMDAGVRRETLLSAEELAKGVRSGPRFSPEQIDQSLWYLLGEPFWLSSELLSEVTSPPEITALTRAMYCPFRDYYLQVADRYSGSAFFMWWDSFSALGRHPVVGDAAIDVLRQILVLPHKACRDAALHGLNHLYPDSRAALIIEDYLNRNRPIMSKEEIDWVEACKAGLSQ